MPVGLPQGYVEVYTITSRPTRPQGNTSIASDVDTAVTNRLCSRPAMLSVTMSTDASSFLSVRLGVVRTISQTYSNLQCLLPHLTPFILWFGVTKLMARYNDLNLVYFGLLFTLRYYRLFISLYGFWTYRPSAVPKNPMFGPKDITLILCTVSISESHNPDFEECLTTWLLNRPARVIIVTDTEEREAAAKERYFDICIRIQNGSSRFLKDIGATDISVVAVSFIHANLADKRTQMALAIPMVRTPLIVTFDDHVFVKPRFLQAVAAVFEDPQVGLWDKEGGPPQKLCDRLISERPLGTHMGAPRALLDVILELLGNSLLDKA